MLLHRSISTLFPYTTLFRSEYVCLGRSGPEQDRTKSPVDVCPWGLHHQRAAAVIRLDLPGLEVGAGDGNRTHVASLEGWSRSEEHTSELQSHSDLVCRLLLE